MNDLLTKIIVICGLLTIVYFLTRHIIFKPIKIYTTMSNLINSTKLETTKLYTTKKQNMLHGVNTKTKNKKQNNMIFYSDAELSKKKNNCIGWNNLVYNNDSSRFNRINCHDSDGSNGSKFKNLGPGKSRCYKSKNNTEPLYKEFDKSNVDFNKYNNLGITDKYLGLDENIGTPNITDDKNDTRKSLFNFSYNKCSPDCCPSTYSCSGGCICLSEKQKNINKCL